VRTICLIFIGLGLTISGYLLFRHFAISGMSTQLGTDFCSAVFGRGCDDALQSRLAVQFGIPLAGWGLVYYGTLIVLMLLGWTMGGTFQSEAMTGALLLVLGAACGSIVLLMVMLTGLSPFCPLCAIVHVINLMILFPLKRLTGHSAGQISQTVIRAVHYLVGGKAKDPEAAPWHGMGFLIPLLVGLVIYQGVYVKYTLQAYAAEKPFDAQHTLALFESSQEQEIPVTDADPHLGPDDAPVRMVVFNDFQCTGCKQLAQTVHDLALTYESSLHIVFKHFPLDSVCNPLVEGELHPQACEVAWAAEAAHEQSQFWNFHEALFLSHSTQEITLNALVKHLELDSDQFVKHSTADTTLAKIQADINLGIQLGVDGTPSVFINGRRAHDMRPQALQLLITHEMERHSRMLARD